LLTLVLCGDWYISIWLYVDVGISPSVEVEVSPLPPAQSNKI